MVAETVTIFAPIIKLAFNDNCFAISLYEKALVGIPFIVTDNCEAFNIFKIVAFTKAELTEVVKGFTPGVVIVTIGAGVAIC